MADPVLLYVDDTRSDVELLRTLLEPRGVTVESARSGAGGIAAYDPARHAAVVIDWNLNDMDGWQVAQALLRRHPACPVAFVSGAWEEKSLACARALGVRRHFEKTLRMDHVENIHAFVRECAGPSIKRAV